MEEQINKAILQMHMKEDDKMFAAQAGINADLYKRIDGINLKLWLIMVGVAGSLLAPLVTQLVGGV